MYFSDINPVQAQINNYYSYQFHTRGGTIPYTYHLYSGSLPAGLSLSSSGLLYGIPTAAGNYNFRVQVQDYYSNILISENVHLGVNSPQIAGMNIYPNGTLLNDNGTIYITYKNTKSGFASMSAFLNLGYKLSNVINTSSSLLVNTGHVINTTDIGHPWGSWVQLGQGVYFVHENGLIPISSYQNFINNGGQDRFLVPANSYDFYKPILDLMSLNVFRLR
jgi:hypothetical protein